MRTETLIVGAGQAGLALSRCLTDAGHDHLLLERGRVAERWRSERWDSFRLLTPNWMTRLPGFRYQGPDPDGFMGRQAVIDFFESYARSFDPPVHDGVEVTAVRPRLADGWAGGWLVETDVGSYEAANVVIATGHMANPRVPAVAGSLPAEVVQLHSSRYRNPAQLPAGTIVVVGAGPSGQQIADELAVAGRRVVLAAGAHRSLPRRYRGRDVYLWMERLGLLERTVDSLDDPDAVRRTTRSSVLAGGDEDLDLRRLVRHGVRVTGRLLGSNGQRLQLGGDLAAEIAAADANAQRLRELVDAHVRRTGEPVPEEPWPSTQAPTWAAAAPRELDLRAEDVSTVVWATGYGRDWSWVHAPVFDEHAEPVHSRGVTPAAGLSFLGLRWQQRRSSAFIDGVGADAAYLAELLTSRSQPTLAAVAPLSAMAA